MVIIVPSQGHDTNSFESVAKTLKAQVYHHATIIRTTVTQSGDSLSVTFTNLNGTAFSWDPALHLARVLTISHAFSGDGPNLAYEAGGYQPWGSNSSASTLAPEGQAFWQSVGQAMQPNGKIILLGCFMGLGHYAENVAKASGKKVFASTDLFAAGNAETGLKYVRAIEEGRVLKPLKSFGP
ncbi:MAG TPA: hypothetical protein VNO32_46105 [Candidatus Acidoferrum sp.]|nr:hypothetical protein [Candidatus Acidoferrum sp.]